MIANVENINMGSPNSESSMGEKKFTERVAQSDTGVLRLRSKKLLIRRNEKPYNSFRE